MIATDNNWTLVAKLEDAWVIQIAKKDVDHGSHYQCIETGAIFRVHICGTVDHRAAAAGKRLVRFHLIKGDARLEAGYHMVSGA